MTNESLDTFLRQWEQEYQTQLDTIPLLDPQQANALSPQQRKYFAELFWHVRGHFAEFLFLLANLATNRNKRLMIVDNIADELGARADGHTAHDVLYNRFSKALGADTERYILASSPYPQFLRDYNQTHLKFFLDEPWDVCDAAFSSYEYLDNADYGAVEKVGKAWGLSRKELEFFEVHRKSDHFGEVSEDLSEIWVQDNKTVQRGFDFIGNHQLKMWRELSDVIFNYEG